MDITRTYTKESNGQTYYVYDGVCDNIPTKWITQSEWEFGIGVQFVDGEAQYRDGNGEPMFVYDLDDSEYNDW